MDRKLDLRGGAILAESEIRQELAAILALEEAPIVDWQQVEARCLSFGRRDLQLPSNLDHINHFLNDFDIRRRDPAYAEKQRSELRDFLNKS